MEKKFIIAVDIGTSATRAIVFNHRADLVKVFKNSYPIYSPNPGWSEQDADEVFEAVFDALEKAIDYAVASGQIVGMSFCSQNYSALVVDSENNLLTRCLTWNDKRSVEIVRELRNIPEVFEITQVTGCPISEAFPLAKIIWLQRYCSLPEGAKFIGIKDYVIYRLSGCLYADWATASTTGIFDIEKRVWSEKAMNLLGISPQQLPELVSPNHFLPYKSGKLITKLGLDANIPILIGSGDAQMSSLGVGAIYPETIAVNVGTSAAARAVVREPIVDPKGQLWTFNLDETSWVVGGITGGGLVYDWFIRTFLSDMQNRKDSLSLYAYVDQLVQQTQPGAGGLQFVPYIAGEQSPGWSYSTTGSFSGMKLDHTAGHFARAVMEGLAFSLYRIADEIQTLLETPIEQVFVTGGLTASDAWLQIAADVFNVQVFALEYSEGSARGTAIFTALALGLIADPAELFLKPTEFKTFSPDQDVNNRYKKLYSIFLEVLSNSRANISGG